MFLTELLDGTKNETLLKLKLQNFYSFVLAAQFVPNLGGGCRSNNYFTLFEHNLESYLPIGILETFLPSPNLIPNFQTQMDIGDNFNSHMYILHGVIGA